MTDLQQAVGLVERFLANMEPYTAGADAGQDDYDFIAACRLLLSAVKEREWPHDGKDWVIDEAIAERVHRVTGYRPGAVRSVVRAYLDERFGYSPLPEVEVPPHLERLAAPPEPKPEADKP